MIQFDLRKGICLANPQRMCRHLLLPHVCVRLHMMFHHNLHRPAKKHNQFFCHDLFIRPVLHYYMIQCESKERYERPVSIQDVPLFHQLLSSPQWCLDSDRSPCGWSAPRLSGNVDSSQEALLPTVFKGFFWVYFFAKMLTHVCSMYMYVQV